MNNPLKNNLLLKTTKSMATKCIVLGQPEQEKKGKPIEFVEFINGDGQIEKWSSGDGAEPNEYAVIELVSKSYTENKLDLMFAWDFDRNERGATLFLGHWNDGFVE